MSELYESSKAFILQKLLTDECIAVLPNKRLIQSRFIGPVMCFANSLPDDVDNAILLFDSVGQNFGRRMDDGSYGEHFGIKVTVRGVDDKTYGTVERLSDYLDTVKNAVVCLGGYNYNIHTIYRQGQPVNVGEEGGKRRQLWAWMVRMVMRVPDKTVAEC